MTNVMAAELDLENLLLRLPHVLAARVQLGEEGTISRIHILASRAARGAALRAQVERLLEEQRALRVDPGVIRVAALENGAPSAAEEAPHRRRAEPARIELRRLTFEPADEFRVRAAVELKLGEIVFTGEASDTDVPRVRPVLAARAVLEALKYLREHGVAFYLLSVEFLTGFHSPVALALVEVLSAGGTRDRKRSLTGCALVSDSREDAAARAVLAAVNRLHGSFRAPAAR